jgi:hypothetical protein
LLLLSSLVRCCVRGPEHNMRGSRSGTGPDLWSGPVCSDAAKYQEQQQ